MTDEALFAEWIAGERKAGAKLFARYYAPIARFFANKAGPAADDLAQQTFASLVESRGRFEGRASFRTFAFAVAHNVLRNHYRSLRRAPTFDPGSHGFADLAPGAETHLGRQRESRRLLAALRAVPMQFQVVLELYYFERLKAREIAEILGDPEGTIRTRLRRAKELLAARLVDEDGSLDLQTTVTKIDDWAAEVRARVWGGSEDAPPST